MMKRLHYTVYKYEGDRVKSRKIYPIDLEDNLADGWVLNLDGLDAPKAKKPDPVEEIDNTGPVKPERKKPGPKPGAKKGKASKKPGRPVKKDTE